MLNPGIEKRRRIVCALFVLFVFFATNFAPIDVLWQLGHPPNGFPSRYSFVLSFLLIELAAGSLSALRRVDAARVAAAAAGIALLYALVLWGGGGLL